jgi:hypothetical protein
VSTFWTKTNTQTMSRKLSGRHCQTVSCDTML